MSHSNKYSPPPPSTPQTQRSTDRVNRIIIQDITELEASSKIKEGIPRSEIRFSNVVAKLTKLENAFTELLAFV